MTIEHLDIEEWIAIQTDLDMTAIKIVTCEECNGSGVVTCDECGHERPCEDCYGAGKVTDYGIYEDMYEKQMKADETAFKRYLKAIGDKR